MSAFKPGQRGSPYHILNALLDWGIPLNVVENVTVGTSELKLNDKTFGTYKYFDGIEQPLFMFQNEHYNQLGHKVCVTPDGEVSEFRLRLSSHGTPALISTGDAATPKLHAFIYRTLTNVTTCPWYKTHTDADAFFQGGSNNPDGQWFYVEFWRPAGAQKYVDKFNEEYKNFQPLY